MVEFVTNPTGVIVQELDLVVPTVRQLLVSLHVVMEVLVLLLTTALVLLDTMDQLVSSLFAHLIVSMDIV